MISFFKKPASLLITIGCCVLTSCSINRQITKQAKLLLADSAVNTGHVGISIYEPATGKYWYSHNATQYFIPASNTKLFSLYAGMKYLGDSLVGCHYKIENNELIIAGSGDPTFLHPDFKRQNVFDFLKQNSLKQITLCQKIPIYQHQKDFTAYAFGWTWDDFGENYMLERNFFPIYGNTAKIIIQKDGVNIYPSYFNKNISKPNVVPKGITATRSREDNFYFVSSSDNKIQKIEIPIKFGMDRYSVSVEDSLLSDTLKTTIGFAKIARINYSDYKPIHSQPSDSLFKPMMHRSDNFFAEQTLLMASNEYLGYMSDEKMIDTILKTTLKEVPQKPKWVDGSGLSRYNLFTPNSFVYILNKMKDEFGIERMKVILATGGEGTLSNYFKNIAGNIYAKTGTLSNNCALSGYLITSKGKLLIFSILNNNYITGATPVRRAAERFLQYIQKKY